MQGPGSVGQGGAVDTGFRVKCWKTHSVPGSFGSAFWLRSPVQVRR
jgi:hypothetical protein